MKKKVAFFCTYFIIAGCGTETDVAARIPESPEYTSTQQNKLHRPLSLLMPSTNYNKRPENTKIDAVIVHHTAPFASLTRVGYFFQDINSRVSAHYTIGKEGLIIQSVAEEDRAWHGGLSSWLGKYGLNDYSIGIELLNDGDSKDPFTEPQYEALAELTAYLLRKYDIPLDRVIGHRDIAIPLGRKIDPADNFDWKYFKAKVRTKLGMSGSFFGWGELPSDNLPSENKIKNLLYSRSAPDREEAVKQLLTFPHTNLDEDIKKAYYQETDPAVKIEFLNLFSWYENKQYISSAREIMADNNNSPALRAAAIRYLSAYDRDYSMSGFQEMIKRQDLPSQVMSGLVNALGSSKNAESKNILVNMLNQAVDSRLKKELISALAGFNDKTLNPVLLSYLSPEAADELKMAAIESLRITYDQAVEQTFLKLLGEGSNNYEIMEAISWVFMRVRSQEGMKAMMQNGFYDRMAPVAKIGLINTVADMKLTEAEGWLIEKAVQTRDDNVKAAAFLTLGRLAGEKSFAYLLNNFNYNLSPELNFVLLKALSNYDRPEVSMAIEEILERNIYQAEIKLLAISAIKEKKLKQFIHHLENALKSEADEEMKIVIRDTLEVLKK